MTKVIFDEMLGKVRQEDQGSHGQTLDQAITYNDQDYLTNDERIQALANVSNQTGDAQTGKMGYKVLQPGASFASQVTDSNTIYEIKDVFDLGGSDQREVVVLLPANSMLKFNGGLLKNCKLVLNNTFIEGVEGLDPSVTLEGGCQNAILCSDVYKLDKTGATDCTNAVQSLVDVCKSTLLFSNGTYKFSRVEVDKDIIIDGNLSVFKSDPLTDGYASRKNVITISDCTNAIVKNVRFEGAGTGLRNNSVDNESPLHFIDVDNVIVVNCAFSGHISGKYNVPVGENEYAYNGTCLSCHGCSHVTVKGCEFFSNKYGEWIWIYPSPNGGSFLLENSVCVFENNYIHNYPNDTERENSPLNIGATNVTITGNVLENYSYRGSLINSMGRNVYITNNIVKDCHARSVFDTCEWGQWYNDYVEATGNIIDIYNGCAFVLNPKIALIENNNIKAECGVNVYGTYLDAGDIARPTPDDNTSAFGFGESIIIRDNLIDADNHDPNWLNGEVPVHSGVEHAIHVWSFKEVGKAVVIENNDITINPIEDIEKDNRQPISIRNFSESITIKDNRCANGMVSSISSVDPGFVVISNTLSFDWRDINLSGNIVRFDQTSVYQTDLISVISYNFNMRITNLKIDGNLYLNQSVSKNIVIFCDPIIENLNIKETKVQFDSLRLVAINVYTDFITTYQNTITPRSGVQYKYNGLIGTCINSSTDKCSAKYYVGSNEGDLALENQQLFRGDVIRVAAETIYVLLSSTCQFGDSIPTVTETTHNTIIDWASKKWLVLTRARSYFTNFYANSALPNVKLTDSFIFYNTLTTSLSIAYNGSIRDVKGWRALGIKGTSFPSVDGGDEGYLFYRTDIKLWCSLYVDRSNPSEPMACWQILGNGRGSTSLRPTVLNQYFGKGFKYYDTTIGKEIMWNGSTWVNVDGSPLTSYSITNTLAAVTNSNSATSIDGNKTYVATLTPSQDMVINSVQITMGGIDVTSFVYNNTTRVIYIPAVTGNLVITASAGTPT